MSLPARAPKKQKRATRWKSQAHRTFVCREFTCAFCGEVELNREPAHVRIGSNAGMGEKPDDWRCVPLCGGPAGCHATQHKIGERTFWADYEKRHGQSVEQLIESLIKVSPRRAEIEAVRREREDGR
jgi:hypothetical protein